MKTGIPILLAASLASCAGEPPLPIAPDIYRFQQRLGEQPSMQGANLEATIHGRHIEPVNQRDSTVLPQGLVEGGALLWHARSRQSIIGAGPEDARAAEVGGCSEGSAFVDLVARVYWTC